MTRLPHSAIAFGLSLLAGSLIVVTAMCASAATLTWNDNATNELGYKIERATGPCATASAFTQVGEVGTSVSTFVDSTTQTGSRYCYQVRAWNLKFADDQESAQYSGYSNKAAVEYPLAAPADPSGLGVTAQ